MTTASLNSPAVVESSPLPAVAQARASLPYRYIALLADQFVLFVPFALIAMLASLLHVKFSSDWGIVDLTNGNSPITIQEIVADLILFAIYYPLCLKFRQGKTFGMSLCNIAVVSQNGEALTWVQCLGRSVLLGVVLSAMTLFGGTITGDWSAVAAGMGLLLFVILPIFEPQGRTFHDYAASTHVISTRPSKIL